MFRQKRLYLSYYLGDHWTSSRPTTFLLLVHGGKTDVCRYGITTRPVFLFSKNLHRWKIRWFSERRPTCNYGILREQRERVSVWRMSFIQKCIGVSMKTKFFCHPPFFLLGSTSFSSLYHLFTTRTVEVLLCTR